MYSLTCSGLVAVSEKAVSGRVTADWSVISCSVPRPMPRSLLAATEVMTSIGTLSE